MVFIIASEFMVSDGRTNLFEFMNGCPVMPAIDWSCY